MSPCSLLTLLVQKKDGTMKIYVDSQSLITSQSSIGILFPYLMTCLMTYMILMCFPRLIHGIDTPELE